MSEDETKTDETPEASTEEVLVSTPEINLGDFINNLDMEELDFVENISGVSLDELEVPGRAKGLFIAGVALVAKRRTQPNFSWSEARALNMGQIKTLIAEADKAKKAPATKSKPTQG